MDFPQPNQTRPRNEGKLVHFVEENFKGITFSSNHVRPWRLASVERVCPQSFTKFWFSDFLSFWNFAKSILLGNGYPTTKLGTAQNRGQTSLKMFSFSYFSLSKHFWIFLKPTRMKSALNSASTIGWRPSKPIFSMKKLEKRDLHNIWRLQGRLKKSVAIWIR